VDEGQSPDPPPGDGWGAQKALQVLALAFLFPAAVVVGYLGGRWLGERFDWPVAGGLVGGVVGAAAGFWQLYQFLRRQPQR
jgi:hypothetical protein